MYICVVHTATHCNTLQYTATRCNILQHTATHCNTYKSLSALPHASYVHIHPPIFRTHSPTRPPTHPAMKSKDEIPYSTPSLPFCSLGLSPTYQISELTSLPTSTKPPFLPYCNTLQQTATHCNTLPFLTYFLPHPPSGGRALWGGYDE